MFVFVYVCLCFQTISFAVEQFTCVPHILLYFYLCFRLHSTLVYVVVYFSLCFQSISFAVEAFIRVPYILLYVYLCFRLHSTLVYVFVYCSLCFQSISFAVETFICVPTILRYFYLCFRLHSTLVYVCLNTFLNVFNSFLLLLKRLYMFSIHPAILLLMLWFAFNAGARFCIVCFMCSIHLFCC